MPDFLLMACVVLFVVVTALRLKAGQVDVRPRSLKERVKFVRVLVVALLAFAAIGFRLQEPGHEPGLVERIVMRLSK